MAPAHGPAARLFVATVATVALAGATGASAQETVIDLEGEVDDADGVDYFAVPFEVPEGIAEIEIRHDDLEPDNVLDWGLLGPGGTFRGYGGGNPEPAIVHAGAASRSYLPGPIAVGTWAVYVGEAKIEVRPARYAVQVILREEATLPAQPERRPYAPPPSLSTEARWYAGDFHVHSRESGDASATFDEIVAFAREQGLDFVELSDHNTTSHLDWYGDVQDRTADLLLIPGVEITTYVGHANAMGATSWIDHRIGVDGRTMEDVFDDALAAGALLAINHPEQRLGERCIGCGWDGDADPSRVVAVEIQTGDAFGPPGVLQPMTFAFWDDLVLAGHHVAAVGGSDDHEAGRGTGGFSSPLGTPTTMVWAEALSVDAIVDGVRRGRTVVLFGGATGPMIELDAADRVDDTVVADAPTLTIRVTRATPAMDLRLVRNGVEAVRVGTEGADPFVVEIPIFAPASGAVDAWRAEVVVGRERHSVTSHLFVRAATDGFVPPDAGSSDAGTGDAGALDASVVDAGPAPDRGGGGGCSCGASGPRGAAWPTWLPVWTVVALGIGIRDRRPTARVLGQRARADVT